MPFRVSGKITRGIPPFKPPPFSTNNNGTTDSFGDMVSNLGASLATIPLISILETVAIAKAFCKLGIIINNFELTQFKFQFQLRVKLWMPPKKW